jgi:hypothetical protein
MKLAFLLSACALFVASYAALMPDRASAANIAFDGGYVRLSGTIEPGDTQKIIALIRESPSEFAKRNWKLDSNGGDISEAMKIGDLVKNLYVTVNVIDPIVVTPPKARCASACFFIYVSALSRNAQYGSIGVHRPYFPPEVFANLSPAEAEREYARLSKGVRDFLVDRGVPNAIIETMFALASNEIRWLSDSELDSIGDGPAWFDQYLVSKCGFNKRMFLAAVTQDPQKAKAWGKCEEEFSYNEELNAISKYLQTRARP